jgi:hypothetical protein
MITKLVWNVHSSVDEFISCLELIHELIDLEILIHFSSRIGTLMRRLTPHTLDDTSTLCPKLQLFRLCNFCPFDRSHHTRILEFLASRWSPDDEYMPRSHVHRLTSVRLVVEVKPDEEFLAGLQELRENGLNLQANERGDIDWFTLV